MTRFDARLRRARSVSPWIHTLDSEPDRLKYRCHWTPPLAIDPFDHNTVYYGCQVIFRTSNGGQSWEVISPDLSTQDPSRVVSSGGVIGDNLGQFYGEVVFAIAPSPIQKDLIWAGTNDGKIWYTRDAGKNWMDVTKNVSGMPEWGTVTKIEPSHFDPATAYVVLDYHLMDNRDPFIYKTTDFGQTWKKISDGLPKRHPLSYAISLAENPNRKGMLFAGTGHAFYYSLDDGKSWTQFKEGLPAAPVTWIVVQKQYHDVVVSTYGRGLYILNDITPLEQADQASRRTEAHLYSPRPGFRLSRSGRAEFTYSLKSAPSDPVQIEILDPQGAAIRTLRPRARTGLNRVSW
ncbi:MAG: WD40/YVTN/BNR-like repeat-containing protein, partial [Acidimicrobiia bacterium]